MAKQTIATIKQWFITNAKPLQVQFWDWLDSFRHKDDKIGMTDLTTELQNKINTSGGSDPVDLSGYVKTSDKGIAGGVASLGTDGKVPTSQLPSIGIKGDAGLSAFQIWVAQGNPNDLSAFWEFLKGADGADGETAYQIAVDNGYTGTQTQWLASLHGEKGADGRSAYQTWIDNGNTGTASDFIASLKGPKGDGGASTWAALQNKPTTVDGFGITDVYTKDQVDGKLSAVYVSKGSVPDYSKLPTAGQKVGDVYNILNAGGGYNAGDNVVWTVDGWDDLAGIVDITGKEDKSQKNQPGGYPGLDANGQLPYELLPNIEDTLTDMLEGGTYTIPNGVTTLLVNPSATAVLLNYTIKLPSQSSEMAIIFGEAAPDLQKVIVNILTIDGNGRDVRFGILPSVIRSGDTIYLKIVNNQWREI